MKVIASHISNLTDARYFAAWGVETMAYNLLPQELAIHQCKEIIDWVQGPKPVFIVDNKSSAEYLEDYIKTIGVKDIIVGAEMHNYNFPSSANVLLTCYPSSNMKKVDRNAIITFDKPFSSLSKDEYTSIKDLSDRFEIYIDAPVSPEDFEPLVEMHVTGIVVQGGEEEKVGYKSFEDLDVLMEAIYW